MWQQKELRLKSRPRGFHLVTEELVSQLPEVSGVSCGVVNFFIQHTSASLCINENADPLVRTDMEKYFLRLVPDETPYFDHTYEGSDDMPAHIKSAILGCSLNVPIQDGRLAMGTWQGIYLGEHRKNGGERRVLATIQGK